MGSMNTLIGLRILFFGHIDIFEGQRLSGKILGSTLLLFAIRVYSSQLEMSQLERFLKLSCLFVSTRNVPTRTLSETLVFIRLN